MSWRKKSYDELPALSVRGRQLRQSLRTVTLAWMFGTVWMSCVAGSRLTIFARMLGFNDFHFGLLGAVPFVATLGQLVATVLIERTGLTKHQFLELATIHRLLWLAVAAIPLVAMLPGMPDLPSRWAVWGMLGILAVSMLLGEMGLSAWWTWMGHMIPRRIRGRYLADRSRIATCVKVPVVIALAIVMDAMTRYHPETGEMLPMTPADQPALLWAICAVFAMAAVVGAIDILLFRGIREVLPSTGRQWREPAVKINVLPRTSRSAGAGIAFLGRYLQAAVFQLIIDPLRDRVFRRYAIYGATVTFAMTVAGSYFWLNMLENLGFSQVAADAQFMVIAPLAGILAAKGWGRLVDRWGRRPTLILGTACIIFSVTPYFFATADMPGPQFVADLINGLARVVGRLSGQGDVQWITPGMPVAAWLVVSVAAIVGGIGWTGIFLAQQGIILGFADGRGRSKYVAAHAVMIGLGGVAGGLIGGAVAYALRGLQFEPILAGPFVWNNWHATFVLSLLARILALVWALRMPDPGSRGMRVMMRYWTSNVYNIMATRLFYPLRIFGWGRRQNKR